MQKYKVKGLYYSPDSYHFATVGLVECDCMRSVWCTRIGAKDREEVRISKSTMHDVDFEEVRNWLAERTFHPLSQNIILVPASERDEVWEDSFFLDRLARVFGPDSFSIVIYDENAYLGVELIDLDIPWTQHNWYFYGNRVEPTFDMFIKHQVHRDIARMSEDEDYIDDRQFHSGRFTKIDGQMYLLNDYGEAEEF